MRGGREYPKYDPQGSIFDDSYWGRLGHSYRLYHPRNLLYSDGQLLQMKAELEAYSKSQQSERTLAQLWDMHYILESNLHPETRQPVAKLFRWSAYCPVNIPIIIGLSVLPPTPFNQIFFQTVNQSYNFGINFSNSTSSNQKSPAELAVSFSLAVGSAICGSVGLRKLLERRNLSSRAGRLLLQSTPLVGLVIANSVNLLFSRSGEVLQGIAVNSPLTGEKIPGVKSQVAGRRALLEGLLLRVAIPAPSFFLPLYASLLAKKRFRFYQRSALARLFYDGAVAYFTIWASLVFAMSFVEPNGRIRLADLEPAVAEKLPGLAPDTLISFSKGL